MAATGRLKLPSAPVREQIASKAAWNESRSCTEADFFTIGYSGRQTADLLDSLVSAGVRSLVDIRQNPVSMYRPDLSKKNLAEAIHARGMLYYHYPELGVPRDVRATAIDAGSREPIWDWYDTNVVQVVAGRNLHWFLNAIEHPAALLCVELDPRECHRHRLALALEQQGLRGFDL